MKKSEKIELRVDSAEKERLSKIAERRGQIISDVVRDALGDRPDVRPHGNSKWPGFVAMVALGISALALWAGLAGPSKFDPPTLQAAQLTVRYSHPELRGTMGPLEVIVPVTDGFKETYEFSGIDGQYKLKLASKMKRREGLRYEVQFCRMVEGNCVDIQASDFLIVPGQKRRMHTRFVSSPGPSGEVISLSLEIEPIP